MLPLPLHFLQRIFKVPLSTFPVPSHAEHATGCLERSIATSYAWWQSWNVSLLPPWSGWCSLALRSHAALTSDGVAPRSRPSSSKASLARIFLAILILRVLHQHIEVLDELIFLQWDVMGLDFDVFLLHSISTDHLLAGVTRIFAGAGVALSIHRAVRRFNLNDMASH